MTAVANATALDIQAEARKAEALLDKLARDDFDVFAEQVGIDDETGEPIRQAPLHRKWAKLAKEHRRLIIWSHVSSGKTNQLSILRTVWELGRDPTLRFAILSNTAGQAEKIVKTIANLIENSEAVQRIFPQLGPDANGPWTNTRLRVKRPNFAKDPSVQAVGVHGALTGARLDRVVIDDILDPENTRTEAGRKDLEAWYRAVVVGRLTKRARILIVGTAYHPRDLLHTLSMEPGWKWVRFPVVNGKGDTTWPELWPPARIEEMRRELGPLEFARQMLCKARDDEQARFQQAWIDVAVARGEGLDLLAELPEVPAGCAVYTGVDLGIKTHSKADETVLFTILVHPNGDRQVIGIEAGRWTGPEIIRRVESAHERYHSIVIIESNAAQHFLLQFTQQQTAVPIRPFITGNQKHDPVFGIESLAVEISNGKWVIPSRNRRLHPEIERWIQEMLFYDPRAHTGDRLMASYFAREAARKPESRGTPRVTLRIVGGDEAPNRTTYSSGRLYMR